MNYILVLLLLKAIKILKKKKNNEDLANSFANLKLGVS